MKPQVARASAHPTIAPSLIALFALVLISAAIMLIAASTAKAGPTHSFTVDFTDYRGGPIDAWLRGKGFAFERDAKDRSSIALSADARGLEVSALRQAQGLLINRTVGPNAYSRVEIEWGVAQHPEGASYENKINNEAIMVQVFFGTEKKPSGSLFAPDIPYFVGLFLCNGDRIGHAYAGRHYQEGGRYVCVGAPAAGQTVTSRFNLKQGARAAFGTAVAEAVSGYSTEVDTSASGGAGTSSAFIKRIRFLS